MGRVLTTVSPGRFPHGPRIVAAVACLLVVGIAAGCSNSTTTAPTTTTTTTTTGASGSVNTVRTMQEALTRVGCYHGVVDGIIGPKTKQAIRDFQAATGLTVDGIYGPNTEGLLTAAAKSGARICTSTPPSTTTTTVAPTTTAPTTTAPAAVSAPCTAPAITAALKAGETLISYQCANGWAAGSWTNSEYAAAFLLQSKNGVWVQPPTDACQNSTALGIPASVLNVSPCKVS